MILTGCRKERPKPSWDVELLTPLIADTIGVQDVLDHNFFTVNNDSSVSLMFEDTLYKVSVDSLVELPDTLFSWGFSLAALPNPIHLQPGDTIIKEVFDWPLDFESYDIKGIKLITALIRSGQIVFEAFDQSETDLQVVFGINSAVRNGTDTLLISEKVPNDEVVSKSFDVSDYRLDLTGSDGDTVNMLNYYLALIVHPDEPGQVTLYPQDSFAVNMYFKDIILNYARGYFGQATFHFGPETYPVDLFSGLDVAGISIQQADVTLKIENNYGIEANLAIQNITAINSLTGESATLQGDIVGTELFVDRATESVPEAGVVQPYIADFDFSNTNFPELISIQPDEISYTMTLETNVMADSTLYNNFLYYDYPIAVSLRAQVNGGIGIDSLFETATLQWNGEGVQLQNVSDGQLTLVFVNGFPFNFNMNLYFQDETHNNIDTLIYDAWLPGAMLDDNFAASQPTETRIAIPLDEGLKESIKSAKYSYYEILVNSAQGENVKIYSDDFLKFKVIGDFQYLYEQ